MPQWTAESEVGLEGWDSFVLLLVSTEKFILGCHWHVFQFDGSFEAIRLKNTTSQD